jgi:hypothetical protein
MTGKIEAFGNTAKILKELLLIPKSDRSFANAQKYQSDLSLLIP